MKYVVAFLAMGILFAGCGSEKVTVSDLPESGESPVVSSNYAEAEPLDIGDVEMTLHMEAFVRPNNIPTGCEVDERRTGKKRLTGITIDWHAKQPETLPITMKLDTRTDFSESPVVLRGKLMREIEVGNREPISTFNTIVDTPTHRREGAPDEGEHPIEFEADALRGLSEAPPTMLLYIEAEAILTEVGTKVDSLDAATATGKPDRTGTLLSNTLRINIPTATDEPTDADATDQSNAGAADEAADTPEASQDQDTDAAEPPAAKEEAAADEPEGAGDDSPAEQPADS